MIALQLYTVRDALQQDYEGTIARVASMGYRAVEVAGLFHGTPAETRAFLGSHGIHVTSAHGVLARGVTAPEIVDLVGELGTNTWVCAWEPAATFTSLDAIQRFADQLNEVEEYLRPRGVKLAYHNHDHELTLLPDGTVPLMRLAELVNPTVEFEIDTYWVQVGGADVIDVVRTLAERAPLLHIKDGPGVLGKSPVAVGDGVMDFPAILAVHRGEYQIVELDNCDTDMMEAVHRSYQYLSNLLNEKAG